MARNGLGGLHLAACTIVEDGALQAKVWGHLF